MDKKVRRKIDVIFLDKKRMSVSIIPKKVIEYFNNIVCEIKANELHSFCIARSVCYLQLSTRNHDREYNCFCMSNPATFDWNPNFA